MITDTEREESIMTDDERMVPRYEPKEPGQVAYEASGRSAWRLEIERHKDTWAKVEKAVLEAAGVDRLREELAELKSMREDAEAECERQKEYVRLLRAAQQTNVDGWVKRARELEAALTECTRQRDGYAATVAQRNEQVGELQAELSERRPHLALLCMLAAQYETRVAKNSELSEFLSGSLRNAAIDYARGLVERVQKRLEETR